MPLPLIIGITAFLGIFLGSYAVKSPALGRSIRTALLLFTTAFCGYGFLASFEVPEIAWKVTYAALGVTALTGATLPWIVGRPQRIADAR